VAITYKWREDFENAEVDALHIEAFQKRKASDDERNWRLLVQHSLGWVSARDEGALVGFVNVVWDGLVHAWIQDLMVTSDFRNHGIGTRLVSNAREACKQVGCEWLHVDFDIELCRFYYQACGFTATSAGIIHLS
jgi:GNAT superfamily N-acetyltransferase